MTEKKGKRVVLCCPTYTRPFPQFLEAVERAVPLLDASGIDHQIVFEVANPYVSGARATMLRKALDAKAEMVIFLDHDVSFDPKDLLALIQAPGDVVAGLYRFKKAAEPEEYMGVLDDDGSGLKLRDDGCMKAMRIPAGFLKVTRAAVVRFAKAYPQLLYGDPLNPSVDLFNHGAHDGVWWGEDYAFSRNWTDIGGEIWVVPDLNLVHHDADAAYPGNFYIFMRRQPGGDLAEAA